MRALVGYFEVTWHLTIKLFPAKISERAKLQKNLWRQEVIVHCHWLLARFSFINFLAVFPPWTYTKLKLEKISGQKLPTLFVGWGEGLDLCESENAPEMQKCPKAFVYDCRLRINLDLLFSPKTVPQGNSAQLGPSLSSDLKIASIFEQLLFWGHS